MGCCKGVVAKMLYVYPALVLLHIEKVVDFKVCSKHAQIQHNSV